MKHHIFEEHSFFPFTRCEVCQELLVGLIYQGIQCKACRMICHHNCKSDAHPICQIPIRLKPHLVSFSSTNTSVIMDATKDLAYQWGTKKASNTRIDIPEEISGLSSRKIQLMALGHNFAVFVTNRSVLTSGNNEQGQLGNGNRNDQQILKPLSFVFKTPVILVSAGQAFCVLATESQVFTWGANNRGQLGLDCGRGSLASPRPIPDFQGQTLSFLTCGAEFCVCVTQDGLWSWGSNTFGQLGNRTTKDQAKPGPVSTLLKPFQIRGLAAGADFCVSVLSRGAVSWGHNHRGQLGHGTQEDQFSPKVIPAFKDVSLNSVACGKDFTLCMSSDLLFSFGDNSFGQLGNGVNQDSLLVVPRPIPFINPSQVRSLSVHASHCLCVTKTDVLYWGQLQLDIYKEIAETPTWFRPSLGMPIQSVPTSVPHFSSILRWSSRAPFFIPSSSLLDRSNSILLLILAREYLFDNLFSKDYLPLDMFRLLLKQ